MTDADSPGAIRHRARQFVRIMEFVNPHLTWILGVILILDVAFSRGFHEVLAQSPKSSFFIFGIMLILTGRTSVTLRKKVRKAEDKAERYEEYYDEATDLA